MAAIGARPATNALILLLGAAVFLNYVDRGAIGIASPLMKSDLGLSEEAYGVVFGLLLDLRAGADVCRLAVRSLLRLQVDGVGYPLWAGATPLMGFAGGFLSLLVLRIMLGVGSISFPGSSKIIARHRRARAARRGQCRCRHRARFGARRRDAGRRPDPAELGLACAFSYVCVRHLALVAALAADRQGIADHRASGRGSARSARVPAHEMAVVVDVHRPSARQLLLLFPPRLAALVPDQVAWFQHR